MPGALVWEDDGEGTWYSDELSEYLRTNLQPLTKFRQFCDAQDAMDKGLHRGSKYHWNIYGDTASQGRELDERTPIPETDIGIDQEVPFALGKAPPALDRADLSPDKFQHRMPFSLSLGEMRRLAFAMASALRPRFLLLDEPTSCLDAAGHSTLREVLSDLRSDGCTIATASHDPTIVGGFAERIIHIDDGHVGQPPS